MLHKLFQNNYPWLQLITDALIAVHQSKPPPTTAASTCAPVQMLAALSLIQLPDTAPEEAVKDGPRACARQPHGRARWISWILASAWSSPGQWDHFGSESVNERSLSIYISDSPFMSLCLSKKYFSKIKR